MKTKLSILIIAAVAMFSACSEGTVSTAKVETSNDTLSYALGMLIGNNLTQDFDEVNYAVMAKAMEEANAESEEVLFADLNEANMFIQSYMSTVLEKKGKENVEKGEAFLEENANKDGIQVTESGLQYEVITEGTGEKPTAESTVKVHYHGTTIDGEVFDSSVESGQPVEFPLNSVIPGWTEGVQLMSVGSKYKLYVPSELAYGARGAGGAIGPNETLIFEVELLEIVK